MRKIFAGLLTLVILASSILIGGCSSSEVSNVDTGIIIVGVTDKPDEDISAIKVTTNLIEASVASDNGTEDAEWVTIVDTEKSFDLIAVAGIEDVLGQEELTAGTYNQIRMHVVSVVVTLNGTDIEADVPSNTIKVVSPITVVANQTTVATFDFDAEQSVVVTGADKVIFKPVVKLLTRGGDKPFKSENAGGSSDTVDEEDTADDSSQGNSGSPGTGQGMTQGDEEEFFLTINSPDQTEVVVDTNTIIISGQTSVDAAVSVGDAFVDVDIDGYFSTTLTLEDDINIIDVVASIADGQQYSEVITVIYAP